ncbi:dipeptidase [Corynebacterium maris DSM 45190]|uniref:Dipeptidase n=1 Tax=Corynebacterium maris DSM 45190 TaxID=1224163 RepID=S5SUF6_9CORY|nr:Xaa-Pro peptidase family protein [Corynebacterium maris]AGS34824.1 dipeptidase [Corynebacterium maris DSM 45190]
MTQYFDADIYTRRIDRARTSVTEQGLGALVVGTGPELAYLTGSWMSSHERLTALVVTGEAAVLIAPATDIAEVAHLDLEVLGWADGQDAHALVAERVGDGPVGLGSSLTADHVLALQAALPAREWRLPTHLAVLKEDAELKQLARAGAAIDAVHAQVPSLLGAGRTEAEVAAELKHLILAEHEAVDFIIVGSGPNGANPHHSFSDRVLQAGDPVVVDVGGTLDSGYHSDCTRTYVVPGGEPPAEFTSAYGVLQRAFSAAVNAVRPGATAQSVDAAAREVIEEGGFGEFFTHRTGHGIGLSTHEEPFIIQGNELVLKEGMCFSVEPGIYVPGQWGMRIEDICAVGGKKAQQLNLQPIALS